MSLLAWLAGRAWLTRETSAALFAETEALARDGTVFAWPTLVVGAFNYLESRSV